MAFTNEQMERYSRHIILQEVGVKGQKKLLNGKVLIIGAGGLGAPAAMYLAAAGVGTIGIVDADEVDLSNLQRQIIHGTADVGKAKVKSAKETMNAMNPDVTVNTYRAFVTSENIMDLIKDYDFIIDGTDNFPAKFLINDACVMAKKPFSHAGIIRFKGQLMPGFYGSMPDGTVKTFSRGGSDITGSIVAKAAKADVYENWTDVSGFLIADPRIIDHPEAIETITYRELRELAYMGATVLHEDAIFPVRQEGIPINIRNTNAPEDNGTWIVGSTCQKSKYVITGIAGKKGFCSVNIEKDMMNSEIGFGRKVLQAFEENGISFEHVPSGIDTMTVFVHQDEFMHKEQKVVAGIHRLANPDMIDIESDLALIAVVGRGMKSTRGTAGRIFSALAHKNINVKMIDQGSSELNIIIGVANEDFETAIKAIYDIFVITRL